LTLYIWHTAWAKISTPGNGLFDLGALNVILLPRSPIGTIWSTLSRTDQLGIHLTEAILRSSIANKAIRLRRDRDVHIECEDNLSYMRPLTDGCMKLIVTSPPYNIGKKYERRKSRDAYVENQAQVISECVRLLHPNGSLCWQVGNHVDNGEIFPLDTILYPIFKQHGLMLHNRIIWHFGHGLHCKNRFSGRYETILWFTKSASYTFNLDPVRVPSKYPSKKHYKGPNKGKLSGNPLGKNPSDVWDIPNVKSNHVEKTIHPCQFPVELIERLVLALTDKGDNIFDPYLGVGTAVVAALKHGRIGYGCDIVQEYIDATWERIHSLRAGTLRTRALGKPVYDPGLPNGGHK